MFGDRLILNLLLSACFWQTFSSSTTAQLLLDDSLGSESSVVIKDGAIESISGGAVRGKNLFHSFSEFNVPLDASVYFNNPKGIDNILTRVTGNNLSQIFGTLGVNGDANLFLLNPNGIIFGENAALDVRGSFLATTAESFIFEDEVVYSATNPETPPLLKLKIPIGLQFGSVVGDIEVRGNGHQSSIDESTLVINRDLRPSGLEVPAKETLALVSGEINLDGANLTAASEGRIELAAVAPFERIELEKNLALDYENVSTYGDINLSQASSLDISNDKPGTIELRGKNITLENGSAIFASTIDSGKKGGIDIRATDALNIIGDNTSNFPSGIFTQVEAEAKGKGSQIDIKTSSLKLQNDASIVSTVVGEKDGGDINIVARQADFIANSNSIYGTGIFTQVLSSKGKAGNIVLDLDTLRLLDNGQTVTQIDNEDDLDSVKDLIEGKLEDEFKSRIDEGKSIIIETDSLVLENGGKIGSTSQKKGGVIAISVNNVLSVEPSTTEEVVSEEISQEIPERVVEEISEQLPEREIEEVAEQLPEEIPKQVVEEVVREVAEEISQEITEQLPEEIVEDVAEEIPEQAVEEVVPEISQEIVEQLPKQLPEEIVENVAEEIIVEIDENVVEEVVNSDTNNTDLNLQRDISNGSFARTIYNFNLGNGKILSVSGENLVRTSQSAIASGLASSSTSQNADSTSDSDEIERISYNSLISRKSSESSFNLYSACNVSNNDYFVNVGRGGLPENPLTNIVHHNVIPDWGVNRLSSTSSFKSSSPIDPIVEAQNWKVNRNGNIELVATSDRNSIFQVRDRVNCLKDLLPESKTSE